MHSPWKAIVFFGVTFLILLVTDVTHAEHGNSPGTYSFGVVPQFDTRKLHSIWQPILKDLGKRTGLKLKLQGAPKIPSFEVAFLAGEYDFAYMNPYHALLAFESQGFVPLIRDHGRELFGVLVVAKTSPIKSVAELNGKTLSFPAPNALGASLLMRADLQNIHNITFQSTYVQTHSSVYLNVILGATPAGGGVMGTLNSQKPEIRDHLRILYKTRTIAPHPVTAHPRVSKEVQEKVRRAFLEMGQDDAGKAMLAKVPFKKVGIAEIADYVILKTWGLENFYVRN